MGRARGTFTTLDNWVLDLAPTLSGSAGWVLMRLNAQQNYTRKTLTRGQLIDMLKLGERPIKAALKLLVEGGYARKVGTEGAYILCKPGAGAVQGVCKNFPIGEGENALPEHTVPSIYSGISGLKQKESEGREKTEGIQRKNLSLPLHYPAAPAEFPVQGEREAKNFEQQIQEQPELAALWGRWTAAMQFGPTATETRAAQAEGFLRFQSVGALSRALDVTVQNWEGLNLPFQFLTKRYEEQMKARPQDSKGSAEAVVAGNVSVVEGQRWVSKDVTKDRVFIVDALIRNSSGKITQAESYKDGRIPLSELARDYQLAE